MELLSIEDLELLIKSPGSPALSIYLPTHRTGDLEQDPIRLKNLLRDAEHQLVGYGIRAAEARTLLDPARQLLSDSPFWQHQSDGLAVFLSPATFRYYRLPRAFKELLVVNERFQTKPLIPLLSEDGTFYVLAVSQKRARLIQCTRYHVRDVTPETVPPSLDKALEYDVAEKQHQLHTTGPGSTPIHHGHGVSKDNVQDEILRYFQQIDQGVHDVLRKDPAPVVMVAVDYLHSIYRKANSYRQLLDEGVETNPDEVSEKELQKLAWPIAESYFDRARTEAMERYHEAVTRGLGSSDVKQTVAAAYDGRISTLFVPTDIEQWGQFDPETRRVDLYEDREPGLDDLLDFAAVHTLTKNGTVYALPANEVPGDTTIAAVFRY